DYDSFVRNLHSVKEDLSAGINAYSEKRIQDAVVLFKRVLDVQLENYTAAYYLALCAYSQKNYKEADSWYKKAMHYGADPALVNWGLGACAYADKRYEEGKVYLLKAKQLDEASYGKKVDDLIMQMP
ncbi:MAG: CDC27 family protein, partial [Spirochaetaceae bacterium]|nr:CDC27 family protein [Spirochaetaceae bacterium]